MLPVWSPGSTTTSYDSDTSPDRNNKTKKVWSPGSSSICSDAVAQSKSDRKKIQTTAISTQTTPEKTSDMLPKGFRSVKASQVPAGDEQTAAVAATSVAAKQEETDSCQQEANGGNGLHAEEAVSPSSMSEISIETANQRTGPCSPPSSAQLKYWTLPRHISSGRQRQEQDDETDDLRKGDTNKVTSLDQTAPKFLYETPSHKYFTLPNPAAAPSSSSSSPHHANHQQQRPSSAYSVPAGVPLTTRPQLAEGHGSDWYKSMFNRLHKYEGRRRGEEEPVRIKFKTRRPKGKSFFFKQTIITMHCNKKVVNNKSDIDFVNRDTEYRFDGNYFSDDEATIPRPRHISEYVTGDSSISEREKQMVRGWDQKPIMYTKG